MTNINFATATTAELEAAGLKVKTLKTRKARKGETHFTGGRPQGAGKVNPNLTQPLEGTRGQAATGGRWVGSQCGQGKEMIRNLDGAIKNYNEVAKANRRQTTLDRLNGIG